MKVIGKVITINSPIWMLKRNKDKDFAGYLPGLTYCPELCGKDICNQHSHYVNETAAVCDADHNFLGAISALLKTGC